MSNNLKSLSKLEIWAGARQLAYFSTTAAIVGWVLAFGLMISVLRLSGQKEQHWFWTTKDSTNQVLQVEPMEKSVLESDAMQELLVENYVRYRETFDLNTERSRWLRVQAFSSAAVFKAFFERVNPKDDGSYFAKLKKERLMRFVHVSNVAKITSNQGNAYQVDWELYLFDQDKTLNWEFFDEKSLNVKEHKSYRSIINYVVQPGVKRSAEAVRLNPQGFFVVGFHTTQRKLTTSLEENF